VLLQNEKDDEEEIKRLREIDNLVIMNIELKEKKLKSN